MGIYILPTVRALIAKKMISEYGYTQKQIAEKMGLTQPAVSQYKRSLRGMKTHILLGNEMISDQINTLAKNISTGMSQEEQTEEFCKLCSMILNEGIACEIHKGLDESLSGCQVCMKDVKRTQGEESRP